MDNTPESYKYHQDLYRDAEMAMTACNTQAVINTFHRSWMPRIKEELKENGLGGTDSFNQHPLVVVFADIILNCAGCQSLSEKVQEAYSVVLARAHAECHALKEVG